GDLKRKYSEIIRNWAARGLIGAVGFTTIVTTGFPAQASVTATISRQPPVAERLAAIRAAVTSLQNETASEQKLAQWGNWPNVSWGNWNNWNKPWYNWFNTWTNWGNY